MDSLKIVIPQEADNLALPDPFLLTYYENLENRTIWLDTEVTEDCLEISRLILKWNKEDKEVNIEDRKPIKIMFFSPGGLLSVNNSMIDIIKISKTPVYGYNMGEALSAGCYIFMSCHKRYSLKNSVFLLHKGSAGFQGTPDELNSYMDNYNRQISNLIDFIKNNSIITEEEIREKIKGEWHITTKEALEYKIIDGIITDINELI